MSHFYASIQGSKREVTRGGGKSSGIEGHMRGWNIGGYVHCRHNVVLEKDEVIIELTKGSNGSNVSNNMPKIIAREKEGGYEIIKAVMPGYTLIKGEFSQEELEVLLLSLNLLKEAA